MSERRRVLLALQGKRFPREGEHGLFTSDIRRGERLHARVEVVRVSATGQTIWTRFVSERAQQIRAPFGATTHRWWRVPDDDFFRFSAAPLYRAGPDSDCAPMGEISFPDVFPEDTV